MAAISESTATYRELDYLGIIYRNRTMATTSSSTTSTVMSSLRADDGFIDELLALLFFIVLLATSILVIFPTQAATSDFAGIHNAAEMAAQASLPYQFPSQAAESANESQAVFAARIQTLPGVSCGRVSVTSPNASEPNYSVSSTCTVLIRTLVPFHATETVSASVKTSIYQGF